MDDFTYDKILELMKNVSKEKFQGDKALYITGIGPHLKDIIKNNPESLVRYMKEIEQYEERRQYLYNELFPVEFELDVDESIKFLNFLQRNSKITLGLLSGTVIGLLVEKMPDILYQKIGPRHRKSLNKDQTLGLLRATWMFLFRHANKEIPTKVSNFMNYCLNSDDREISSQALDMAIRFCFNNSMNLRKSIKRYYFKSLEHKFNVCILLNGYAPFMKDEKLIYFFYYDLFKDILQSNSSDLTIKYSYNLAHLIQRLESYHMTLYQKKYQTMVIKVVNKFIDNNWWDFIKLDHLLAQFGEYDTLYNGKNVKQLLNKKKDDPNLAYFEFFITKAFNFHIIIVDILYRLRENFESIFSPTLSRVFENITDELNTIYTSYNSLIDQVSQKTKDKIPIEDFSRLKADTYENIKSKTEELRAFTNKLEGIVFENKEREINHISNESNRLGARIMLLLDLFRRLESLILDAANSAPWINMTSLLKKIRNQTIYNKVPIYERIILELCNPKERINSDKVMRNFISFPLIKQFFTERWLIRSLNDKSDHPLLEWLNLYNKEEGVGEKPYVNWANRNLLNLEHSLSFFTKINEQGTSNITKLLRQEGSFFDTVVHLQLAKKIKQLGKFDPTVEEKIGEKPVDIFIKTNNTRIILEVTSINMQSRLKYSRRVIQVKDRVREKLLFKTRETSKIKPSKYPIILVIDTSRSPESELTGILNSLRGYRKVSRIFIVDDQHIRGSDIDEEEITFMNIPESINISAVICLKTKIHHNDTEFEGYVFENSKAKNKILQKDLKALSDEIFTNENSMTDPKLSDRS